MRRGLPTPEILLQLWKSTAGAGPDPAGIAEALARGAASAFGDVGGVRWRMPDGRWLASVHGPQPAQVFRGEAPGPAATERDSEAAWLTLAPGIAGELQSCAVAPLGAGGEVLGTLAVARLRRPDGDGAFTPEEAALLRQVAGAGAVTLAGSLTHGRLIGPDRLFDDERAAWTLAYGRDCPSMFFIKDDTGRYMFVNQAMAGFSRNTVEKMIGRTDEELYPPEQAAFFRSIDKQILASGKPAITTDRFFLGGEWRVFLACKFPVMDAQGKVTAVGGHVTPIPDPKTATDALSRGEEQLNFITDALPELMAYVDVHQRFRFVNRAYEKWFGVDRHQIIGQPLLEVFGPDTYELMRPHVELAFAGTSNRFDLRLTHHDGVIRDTRVTLASQRNFTHQVEGVVVLITDMTDQKLAEERLRFLGDVGGLLASRLDDVSERGAPLKTISALSVLKLADWCVVEMVSPDGKLEQLSAAHVDLEKTTLLRGLHGWLTREDSLLHLPRVLANERAELFGEITDEQVDLAAADDPELLMCLREVGLRSAIVVPVTTRSGTIGVIVLAGGPSRRRYDESDLTQAVELARRAALATDNSELFTQKTRAVELRDNFLATASHELRTPLTSLGLHLDALMMEAKVLSKKEPGLSRFQDSLNRAMFHSERLGGLIRQLLDVSRLRDGNQLDIARELVDLGKLVRDVSDRFADEAARASCSLEALIPPQPVIGYWDPLRLDQVATNLIGNAIKYGAGKPVKVEVSAAADRAVLVVRDQGIGIPEEDLDRIFGKFERAVSERHYGGLGLGLWITRQALEAMGGTIRVHSRPNVETVFTVELPLQERPR